MTFSYTKSDVLLDINNVSVSYDGKLILKNVTAQIENIHRPGMTAGQVVALLGPSGCGKTTLFRVLSGIIAPDTGTVTIGAERKPVAPGDVGVVAQNYPLLQHKTILRNLVFAGTQAGLSTKDATVAAKQSLADFDLSEHANKYPPQLSGGQRQRVAIAQQLLCSSKYIVMDEPFSGLDVVALENVRRLITSVSNADEENTFIVVTHDVTSAVAIADTIWLMWSLAVGIH